MDKPPRTVHSYEKGLKDKRSGSAAGGQKVWKYDALMTFLEPFVQERQTSGNMEEEVFTLNLEAMTPSYFSQED